MRPHLMRAMVTLGLAGLLAGGSVASSAPAAPETLDPPVSPMRALSLFDPPPAPWHAGHRGIDLAASVGDAVRAPADGTVTFAGRVVDRGVVTVDVGGGVLSSVEPVDPGVTRGQAVARGDVIGAVGRESGHCSPVTCLHWGVRVSGIYIDPLDVLTGFGPVVLLPRRTAPR